MTFGIEWTSDFEEKGVLTYISSSYSREAGTDKPNGCQNIYTNIFLGSFAVFFSHSMTNQQFSTYCINAWLIKCDLAVN